MRLIRFIVMIFALSIFLGIIMSEQQQEQTYEHSAKFLE